MIKDKIVSRSNLAEIVSKRREKKVGFTSGSFDIIHAGHAKFFEEAKKKCDIMVVAVNSDKSVKGYKGSDRPIVPEKERVMMVASQSAVDFVFKFDERRNNKNIEILKPDYYIKAGDYNKSQLTSAKQVEEYGGKVILIPHYKGMSTTSMINKIIQVNAIEESSGMYGEIPAVQKSGPVVFMDRDGTINVDGGYSHEPKEFRLMKNAGEGMKKINDMDLRIAIVTNQPGIGLGYYTKTDFYNYNKEMLKNLSKYDVMISKIYFCPHSKSEKCSCRKPAIGLFKRAEKEMKTDLSDCYMIGDSEWDILAGKNAGCRTIHVGKEPIKTKPDYQAKDILDAAKWILGEQRK